MDINNIANETQAAIERLTENPAYVNKHTFLNEYNQLTKELEAHNAKVKEATSQNRFDEALELKKSIEDLEKRKEIMTLVLQEKQSQPDFDEMDLIAINDEIQSTWQQYVADTRSRMRELLKECQALQQEMNVQQQKVGQCRKLLLSKTATPFSIRTQIKFRELDAASTFRLLAQDIYNNRF